MEGLNLNLRDAPQATATKVHRITSHPAYDDPYFTIQLTGDTQGNWAQVKVIRYPTKEDYCRGRKGEAQILKGWIKVLNNEGFPNIWSYSDPCG